MPVTPSLDLDAVIPDRETVLIRTAEHLDGKLFEFRGEMELGVLAQQEIGVLWKKVGDAWGDEGIMDVPTAQLVNEWLDEMLTKILHTPLDDEMRACLTDVKKMRIITYFFGVVWPKVTRVEPDEETPAPKKRREPTRTSIGAS